MKRIPFPKAEVLRLLLALVLVPVVLLVPCLAKKAPKTYPEEGKVLGMGTVAHAIPNGSVDSRTYKVVTETRIYTLDCGKKLWLAHSQGECGGDKKWQIGDAVHFRIENGAAYIPITETDSDGKQTPGEQKLRVLSEDLNPDAKAAEGKP